MPTSARGICEGRIAKLRNRGFTLLEMLVVLLIAGIALGTATAQLMPDDRSELRDEAEQLALLLENAELEAQTGGAAMAWLPDRSGYQFWRRNRQGNWRPIDEGPFRFRAWRRDTRIASVLVDGEPLKFGERLRLDGAFAAPFAVRLEHGRARATVNGAAPGAVAAHMEEDSDATPASP